MHIHTLTHSHTYTQARRKKRDKHKARASSPHGTDSVDGKSSDSMTVGNISTKNLQEILSKLTVEEKEKSHAFWDTQPVPKLGELVSSVVLYGDLDLCREILLNLAELSHTRSHRCIHI